MEQKAVKDGKYDHSGSKVHQNGGATWRFKLAVVSWLSNGCIGGKEQCEYVVDKS
jgi:hypothetical protein